MLLWLVQPISLTFQPDCSQLPEIGPDGQAADAKETTNPEDKSVNQILDESVVHNEPENEEQMQSKQASLANAEIASVWDVNPSIYQEQHTTIRRWSPCLMRQVIITERTW